MLQIPQAVDVTVECLRRTVASYRAIEFLGAGRLLRYRSVHSLPFAWGWKDPQTIFTLPLWLKLFPDAKLIYLTRNGVDVAASLLTREQKRLAKRTKSMSPQNQLVHAPRRKMARLQGLPAHA